MTAASVLLGVWFVLSIAAQTPLIRWVRRWDRLGIVPRWYLFTHPMAMNNYKLHVRTRSSNWAQVELWRRGSMFWDPQRRIGQAFFEIVTQLVAMRINRQQAEDSMAYQTLLHFVGELHTGEVQFSIRMGDSILFLSAWHST